MLSMLLPVAILLCPCIVFAFSFPTNAKWQPMYVVHGLGISAKAIWLPMCLHYISMLFFHLVFCATKSSKLPMFYKVFMFPSYLQFISSPLIDNTYVILSPTMPSNFIFFSRRPGATYGPFLTSNRNWHICLLCTKENQGALWSRTWPPAGVSKSMLWPAGTALEF